MFTMITEEHYPFFETEIHEIGQLRHRVFVDRLNWVAGEGDVEVDSFDEFQPTYLAYRHPTCGVVSCVRFLPTTGPNMLRDCFPQLLDGNRPPAATDVVESSRFCVDTKRLKAIEPALVGRVTSGMLLAMLEYGLFRGYSSIVTVTDLRVERIVRLSGWDTVRLGTPQKVGDTTAVAIAGPVTQDNLSRMRKKANDHTVKLYALPAIAA